MVGGMKSCLQSNQIPTRDARRAQILCAPGPGDLTETEPELCLSVSCEGMGQHGLLQGRGSRRSRPGDGISPLGGGPCLPQNRATRGYIGLGKQSWRAQAKLCVQQNPGERSGDPTRD